MNSCTISNQKPPAVRANSLPSLRVRVYLAVLTLLMCPASVAVAADLSFDRTVMVIMAPEGPVLAEINISVEGQAYRLWVTKFLARRVDVNNDGALNLGELQLIPERLLQQTTARTAKRVLRSVTGDKKAETTSVDAFTEWFTEQLSRSFDVVAAAVNASEAVRLAALVDGDGDGAVSREELMIGSHALRFRDLDDDQTFTAAELMPYRDPRNQNATVVPDAANLPFVQLGDEESLTRTAEQIVSRYGNDDTVDLAKLRLPETATTGIDGNNDSKLDAAETKQFLAAPTFHLTLDVQLAEAANRSNLVANVSPAAQSFVQSDSEKRGRMKLVIDDMPLEIRARGGSARSRDIMVRFLLQRSSLYDKDKNGYFTDDEYPEFQTQMARYLANADFQSVDLNGDKMVLRQEIKTYIERDAIATQSRIEVSVKQDGKTLFKLLDENKDRRLAGRELLEGFDILLEYDLNKDQRLTESELGTAYSLQIGLGQPASLRMNSTQAMGMAARSTDAILPGVSGLSGPEWFRRMDRNQDRDVSYREFLAPRSIFEQLDKDSNGLLSAAEAEALTE
jgi:Ca2+-binding EF-hand superfamily protein